MMSRTLRRVLHLVGSGESERLYNVSMLYASSCRSYGEFDFVFAVLTPDKLWTFARRIHQDGYPEVDSSLPQRVPLHIAITFIMTELKPDVAVNHMYGQLGTVHYRSLMELLDIPVVGSNSNVQRITKDKVTTRAILVQGGVQMPKAIVFNQFQPKVEHSPLILKEVTNEIGIPCVVKAPSYDDSTGVFHVTHARELIPACEKAFELDNKVVVEEFISGREVRSAIFESENGELQMLPIIEYGVDRNGIRDSTLKLEYDTDGNARKSAKAVWFLLKGSDHPDGELLNDMIIKNVQKASIAAYQLLDLQDFGLFDFRVSATGKAYLLEVNLFWSLGAESIMNVCACEAGFENKWLLKTVLNRTMKRIDTTSENIH